MKPEAINKGDVVEHFITGIVYLVTAVYERGSGTFADLMILDDKGRKNAHKSVTGFGVEVLNPIAKVNPNV